MINTVEKTTKLKLKEKEEELANLDKSDPSYQLILGEIESLKTAITSNEIVEKINRSKQTKIDKELENRFQASNFNKKFTSAASLTDCNQDDLPPLNYSSKKIDINDLNTIFSNMPANFVPNDFPTYPNSLDFKIWLEDFERICEDTRRDKVTALGRFLTGAPKSWYAWRLNTLKKKLKFGDTLNWPTLKRYAIEEIPTFEEEEIDADKIVFKPGMKPMEYFGKKMIALEDKYKDDFHKIRDKFIEGLPLQYAKYLNNAMDSENLYKSFITAVKLCQKENTTSMIMTVNREDNYDCNHTCNCNNLYSD